MNHKRRKSKRQRAGCKMCKPHKQNGQGSDALPISVRRHEKPNRVEVEEGLFIIECNSSGDPGEMKAELRAFLNEQDRVRRENTISETTTPGEESGG